MTQYNLIHIDYMFFLQNLNTLPMVVAGPWSYQSNNIYENVNNPGSVNMQGLFIGGGSYYDQAFEDSQIYTMENPVPGAYCSFNGITWDGGFNFTNQIIRNTKVWGRIGVPSDSAALTFTDMYMINDDAGTWLDYPNVAQFNPLYCGFSGASSAQNLPFNGTQNLTVWPSLARGVDTNGVPNLPGTPAPGNLSASPWYGPATDTGLGGM